ncbi:hypothetical protein [Nonomuraea sp. C10]|uniref:hypothetical protein n=1 Tax=Nonomuraea sp. C10 TaxID=2600577 RepID=UPI0011CE1FA8|nr:hypothetical protein [Nonomuraea sp. C10]TXK35453.1 hypothetical protein FR742_40225 [Nonomuraea sp. C10]
MGFWKTVVGLALRKSVGPPVVVAAVLLALAGWLLVPDRYVSTASMVLTVPASGGTLETLPESKPGLTNPLLQFNDALRTTAGILILATNTPEVAASLGVAEDGPTSLTINDGRTNPDLLGISTNGPFVYVEVESTSPRVVREVMAKAQQRVKLELAERQVALDAPISTHIGILDVMPASVPKPIVQGRLMAAAGGAFAGVTLGLALAFAITRLGVPSRLRLQAPERGVASPEGATGALAAVGVASPKGSAATGSGHSAGDGIGAGTEPRRNGTPLERTTLPAFPLTVEELSLGGDPLPAKASGKAEASGEAEDVGDTQQFRVVGGDTGPIEVVTREGQPDSTT